MDAANSKASFETRDDAAPAPAEDVVVVAVGEADAAVAAFLSVVALVHVTAVAPSAFCNQ